MDYASLRLVADSLIDNFSNGQAVSLLKGEKTKDPVTGRLEKSFREVAEDSHAVMARYSEEAIAKSNGVIEAGDVKFVCRFSEKPLENVDRIRFAGEDYNIVHCQPVDPTGAYVITYIVQGRKA